MSENQTFKRGVFGHFQQPNSCRKEASGPDTLSKSTAYLASHATVSPDIGLVHVNIPATDSEDTNENMDGTVAKVKSY